MKKYKQSEEVRQKRSELYRKYFEEGRIKVPTTKGLKFPNRKKGYHNPANWTPELRQRLREAHLGKPKMSLRGENHYLWKGGVTPLHHKIRNSLQYKLWRKSIFERDNYRCVSCGDFSRKGHAVRLEADHIKSFSEYPELRFNLDNGRTLCKACHVNTPSYGVKRQAIWRLDK